MLRSMVQSDEGLRLFVYDDATGDPIKTGSVVKGNPTIGYGLELSKDGITGAEATQLLDNRLELLVARLTLVHPDVLNLDPVRQIVLANMAYNVGLHGLDGFHNMWAALDRGDFAAAAKEILNSTAAQQLPARYQRLAKAMESATL